VLLVEMRGEVGMKKIEGSSLTGMPICVAVR
jgi:hypothetical protein